MRAAEHAAPRDKALAHVGFYGGLRIAEIVALDVDDIRKSARKGHLVVRYGKGGRYREVPLHPSLRSTLDEWLAVRAGWPGTDIVIVAEILGHSVETARRYALPSDADRQAAIERLPVDE